jgi:Zn-finger nucleic acid-binding protein
MKCPVCLQPDLLMTNREGVEIDYCPQCRGVWLDRGELDKLIERSAPAAPRQEYREQGQRRYDESDYRRHKTKNVWKELFDF